MGWGEVHFQYMKVFFIQYLLRGHWGKMRIGKLAYFHTESHIHLLKGDNDPLRKSQVSAPVPHQLTKLVLKEGTWGWRRVTH